MGIRLTLVSVVLLGLTTQNVFADNDKSCPNFLNQKFKVLHSSKTINLCTLYSENPLLIVNTASHCGFTKQFKPLDALYKKYKDQGFKVIGFASNDFNQEAKTEEEAADICYKNYGVTFTMLAPTNVKGDEANSVFTYIAKQSGKQPDWNFNKYLVSADGQSVQHFSKESQPLGGEIERLVMDQLSGNNADNTL